MSRFVPSPPPPAAPDRQPDQSNDNKPKPIFYRVVGQIPPAVLTGIGVVLYGMGGAPMAIIPLGTAALYEIILFAFSVARAIGATHWQEMNLANPAVQQQLRDQLTNNEE